MASDTLKQWQSTQDALEHLTLHEIPIPDLGDDEVLVKISSVSLNYRDTEVCMGLYSHHRSIGHGGTIVPCSDACGTIEKLGRNLKTPWNVGDRVLSICNQSYLTGQITAQDMSSGLGLPLPGVLATYRVFPSHGLVKPPDHLSNDEASTLPIAAVTAWMSLFPFEKGSLRGKTVLLIGTGGVAVAGLQIAKASGASVIILSSSNEKLKRARELGADHTINYNVTPNWSEQVMEITKGAGADIIFELGGANTITQSFASIAFGGFIACIGYLGGKQDLPHDRTNINVLALQRNVTLRGILNGPRDEFEKVCEFYEQHDIHPVIDRIFPFEEAGEALQHLYRGGHFGKLVVRIRP